MLHTSTNTNWCGGYVEFRSFLFSQTSNLEIFINREESNAWLKILQPSVIKFQLILLIVRKFE